MTFQGSGAHHQKEPSTHGSTFLRPAFLRKKSAASCLRKLASPRLLARHSAIMGRILCASLLRPRLPNCTKQSSESSAHPSPGRKHLQADDFSLSYLTDSRRTHEIPVHDLRSRDVSALRIGFWTGTA